MVANQDLQLAYEVGGRASIEVLLHPFLDAREPELVEPGNLGLRKAAIRELRQGRAAPQRQRVASPSFVPQLLEASEIDPIRFHPEQVARRPCLEPLSAEQFSQLRDVDLQRLLRGLGWLILPKRVDQPVARDDAIHIEQQRGEEHALLRAAQLEAAPVLDYLERAEDQEFHRPRRR